MAQLTNKEIEQIKSILRKKPGPQTDAAIANLLQASGTPTFKSTQAAAKKMQQILKMSEQMYGPKKTKTSLELKKALKGMK